MRTSRIVIVLLVIACAALISYWPSLYMEEPAERAQADDANESKETPVRVSGSNSSLTPTEIVEANRGSDVAEGFRGEVHPVLTGQTRMEVSAYWTPVGEGRDKLHEHVHEKVYILYKKVKPVQARQLYTEKDFSAFLPETFESVGQVWALDADKVVAFLKQFHPNASMQVVAKGRRAGPDGAFGILQAISPDYYEVAYRLHAEFNLTPRSWRGQPVTVWYTPAYFTGRLLVNRKSGTVDYFRLGIPTEKPLNMHLTVFLYPHGEYHDIVRVEQMELFGGDLRRANSVAWEQALDPGQANGRLARQFYKFNDIQWVPVEQALAQAQSRNKPIFAMVLWGSLDDQSC